MPVFFPPGKFLRPGPDPNQVGQVDAPLAFRRRFPFSFSHPKKLSDLPRFCSFFLPALPGPGYPSHLDVPVSVCCTLVQAGLRLGRPSGSRSRGITHRLETYCLLIGSVLAAGLVFTLVFPLDSTPAIAAFPHRATGDFFPPKFVAKFPPLGTASLHYTSREIVRVSVSCGAEPFQCPCVLEFAYHPFPSFLFSPFPSDPPRSVLFLYCSVRRGLVPTG